MPAMELEDHEAAWAVLQVISMEPTYMSKTAYNLFTLFSTGNAFEKSDPVSNIYFSSTLALTESTGILGAVQVSEATASPIYGIVFTREALRSDSFG